VKSANKRKKTRTRRRFLARGGWGVRRKGSTVSEEREGRDMHFSKLDVPKKNFAERTRQKEEEVF